jgi:hypothetical protein
MRSEQVTVENSPSKSRIVYRLLSGVSPERARLARAKCWLYITECFNSRVEKEGEPQTRPGQTPYPEVKDDYTGTRE